MRVICAWCEKVISDDGSDEKTVSHGCCKSCLLKIIKGKI